MKVKWHFLFKILLYSGWIYFIYLLVLITLQYTSLQKDIAFLRIKQEEANWVHYRIAFFSHVFSSIFVIIAGLTQFSHLIRSRFPKVHRISGFIYIFLILCIASPSGLVMAYYANGGWISQISFIILSVLWFYFTYKAYQTIKLKKYIEHRDYMIRSYALTLSAVSLRLFKYGIVSLFALPPMDTYRIVSVLGWTVNLLIAELCIYFLHKRKTIN
ncbi:DUF2306 domain-containing protein [Weeksellaceae bacterium TAE3-ERU29]|nr:DUF2306 domain-containing protein [Weeksellaceae bacterium TAE3-ERU29]